MTRKSKSNITKRRCYRFEKLEFREMLSADGFSFEYQKIRFDGFRSENLRSTTELVRQNHSRHSDRIEFRSLTESVSRDLGRQNQDDRSDRRGRRHSDVRKTEIVLDRLRSQNETNGNVFSSNTDSAEGEFIQQSAPLEELRTSPISIVISFRPATSPVVSTPVVNESLPSVRSTASQLPPLGIPNPATETQSALSEGTSTAEPAVVSASSSTTEAVRLVSVSSTSHELVDQPALREQEFQFGDHKINATPRFSVDEIHFERTELNQWLQESERTDMEFAELDQLLDAIAAERTSIGRQNTANSSSAMVPSKQVPAFTEQSESKTNEAFGLAGSPILLMPSVAFSGQSARIADEVLNGIDESSLAQWSVGIGFPRRLEFLGETPKLGIGLSDAYLPAIEMLEQENPSDDAGAVTLFSGPVEPMARGAGVLLCLAGVHYVRSRRFVAIEKRRVIRPLKLQRTI